MESLFSIKDILKKCNFICKLDLKDAYFYILFFLSLKTRGNMWVFTGKIIYISLFAFILTLHQNLTFLPNYWKYQQTFFHCLGSLIIICLDKMLIIGRSVRETLVYRETVILLMHEFCERSGEICNDLNINNRVIEYENKFQSNGYLTPERKKFQKSN